MKTPIRHSLMKALCGVPGFDLLGDVELLEIVGASINLVWPAGECVFTKGMPGEGLYIVLAGKVRIYDEVDGRDIEIAETGPGDYFGEHSLLRDTKHTKNVQALEDTELLVLPKDTFSALLESNDKLKAEFERVLEERANESSEKYETTEAR